MARKFLFLLVITFLVLTLISNNKNNVYAVNTEDLVLNSLNDQEKAALLEPLAEQTSEAKAAGDNPASKAIDGKEDQDKENENNGEKEINKEEENNNRKEIGNETNAKKSEGEDKGLEKKEGNENTDDLQEKRRQKRLQNRRNRRRRRWNNLRQRSRQRGNGETDFQELPLSESEQKEAEDYGVQPSTDNIVYIQPDTEEPKQESSSELPKYIKITNRNQKTNNRRKNQNKRAAVAKNRQRNGNARKRGTAAKRPNAQRSKALPARRQPVSAARRSTKKFMLNGIKFPKGNRGKAANRNRQQRRAGRRSNFRRKH